MSQLYQSLPHSRMELQVSRRVCAQRRHKKLLGEIRRELGPIFHFFDIY